MADFFTEIGKGIKDFFSPQQQSSGLIGSDKRNMSSYIGQRLPGQMTTLWERANEPYRLPLGMPSIDESTGLLTPQRTAFDQAVKQAFSKASGTAAMAGQLTPENFSAVAGSAAQNVLPQFAPMIQDVSQYRQALSQVPETVFQQRMQQYLASLGSVPGLLGSQGTGAGLGYNVVSAFAGGLGSSVGAKNCWIAGALYGEGSMEQLTIRAWLLEQEQVSRFWAWFAAMYSRYGERLAARMRRSPVLTRMIRPIFDAILRRATT